MSDVELGSVEDTSSVETETEELVYESDKPENQVEDEGEELEETETDNNEDEEEASLEGSVESEFESIEYDGQTYEVPKNLKDAFMREKDYTEKTTSLAEQRKQFEATVTQAQHMHQIDQASIQARVKISQVQEALSQYDNVDWNLAIEQNPVEAQKAMMQRSQLESQLNSANQELDQISNAYAQSQSEARASKVAETVKWAEANIPDWGPEKAVAMEQFVVSKGVPAQLAKQISEPYEMEMIALAMDGQKYRDMQTKAKKAPREVVKPVKKIAAKKQKASKSLDNMSMDDFVAIRNKQAKANGYR